MKKTFPLSSFFLTLALTTCMAQAGEKPRQPLLATEVMKASGIENWMKVSRVKFSFNKAVDGEPKLRAEHDWEIRKGKDTVKWDGKVATADVWYPDKNEGDALEAYKRWVNDSYWLLAPLKLGDKGAIVEDAGEKRIEGENLPALALRFGKVGLTSNDRYVLYIDPSTKLVKFWDYMPDEKTKKTATWEDYVESGGLNLSTRHRVGNAVITITDLEVIND